jgi:hypothetical protein
LIVAAAGNDGVRTTDYPAAYAVTEPNVIAVGAVDITDPNVDHRAVLGGALDLQPPVPPSQMCDPSNTTGGWPTGGSNCGSQISIAAPANVSGRCTRIRRFHGLWKLSGHVLRRAGRQRRCRAAADDPAGNEPTRAGRQ